MMLGKAVLIIMAILFVAWLIGGALRTRTRRPGSRR
jgi:hypothetical protein